MSMTLDTAASSGPWPSTWEDTPAATLSQKDIARTMGITSNTLKTHLRSLYLKLGVHSHPSRAM